MFLYVWYYIIMRECYDANESRNTLPEKITESTRMKIRNKVVLTLLKDSSHGLFKNLILREKYIREKILTIIIKKYLNGSSDEEIDSIIEDISHTSERLDGSSDGLYEALDIILDDGNRECSNWNSDPQQIWTLKQLFPDKTELEEEKEMELFIKIQEVLFPDKNRITPKEQVEVYNKMKKFLDEISDLIKKLV